MARYVIEFDTPEELVAFTTARGGEVTAAAPKVLISELPQTIKLLAEEGTVNGEPAIAIRLLSRAAEDAANVVTLAPGATQII